MIESIIAKIMLGLLITTAMVTTGVAAKQVTGSLYAASIPKQGIDIKPMTAEIKPTVLPSITPTATEPTPTMEPLVVKKTVTVGKCIITLFGIRYDVTAPNKAHGGGDIFNCGKDMTTIYKSKHGTDVSKMQAFLESSVAVVPTSVIPAIPTTTMAPTKTPTSTPRPFFTPTPTVSINKEKDETYDFSDDEHERDDEENEERYIEDERNDD